MPRNNLPDYEYFPRYLTPEQVKNPSIIIDELFSYFNLVEVRKDMKQILKMTVISRDFHKLLEQKERSDLVWFHGWLEKLLEAGHIIYQQRRTERMKAREKKTKKRIVKKK
jgi:hypothetical protein